MLYKANFERQALIPVEYDIVDLVRMNEEGRQPITVRSLDPKTRVPAGIVMALPDKDSFHCFTRPGQKGGFVYDNGAMYLAKNLQSIDSQLNPNPLRGYFATDKRFEDMIREFEDQEITIFRSIDDQSINHKKETWPMGQVPNMGTISYDEAFRILGNQY